MSSGGIGGAIGNFLGFDPTPGFNIGSKSGGAIVPTLNKSPTYSYGGLQTGGNALAGFSSSNPLGGQQIAGANLGNTADATAGNYTGGTTGTTGGAGSTADIATYTDNLAALQGLLANSDTQLNTGRNSIQGSFDRSNQQLNDQNTGTTNSLDRQQVDTTKGYQSTLNTINSQARNGYRSLQALLGGTGSAGDLLAPSAVSDQAGQQTGNATDSFAGNLAGLATSRKDAAYKYKQAQDDLLGQKNDKLTSLISSIDQQKQNYLGQIGQQQNQLNIAQGGSYQTPTAQNLAIQQLQDEQNNLSSQYAQPAFTPQNIGVQSPDMAAYRAQAAQIGSNSNAPVDTATDPVTAFRAMLEKQKQNQYSL